MKNTDHLRGQHAIGRTEAQHEFARTAPGSMHLGGVPAMPCIHGMYPDEFCHSCERDTALRAATCTHDPLQPGACHHCYQRWLAAACRNARGA